MPQMACLFFISIHKADGETSDTSRRHADSNHKPAPLSALPTHSCILQAIYFIPSESQQPLTVTVNSALADNLSGTNQHIAKP